MTSSSTYTSEELNSIALAGCESLVADPGTVMAYDVEAYERVYRQPVDEGNYPYFNQTEPFVKPRDIVVPQQCATDSAYLLRLGGFQRQDIFGPGEAASAAASCRPLRLRVWEFPFPFLNRSCRSSRGYIGGTWSNFAIGLGVPRQSTVTRFSPVRASHGYCICVRRP